MNGRSVASFEKGRPNGKVVSKTRRISIPGVIEQQEIWRADQIEAVTDLLLKKDRRSWYQQKGE